MRFVFVVCSVSFDIFLPSKRKISSPFRTSYQDGFDATKLHTMKKIKADRGARVGRYVVASTTAKYSEPHNIFSIPCDVCIPCNGTMNEVNNDK
jgi:glutamate dehydrogenase/leucine dehydrogenase